MRSMTYRDHGQHLFTLMDVRQPCSNVPAKEAPYPAGVEPHSNGFQHDPFSRIPGSLLGVRTFHIAHDGYECASPFNLAIVTDSTLEHQIGRPADKLRAGIGKGPEFSARGSKPLFRVYRQGLPVKSAARPSTPNGLIPAFEWYRTHVFMIHDFFCQGNWKQLLLQVTGYKLQVETCYELRVMRYVFKK
jgi:hypothetical protein